MHLDGNNRLSFYAFDTEIFHGLLVAWLYQIDESQNDLHSYRAWNISLIALDRMARSKSPNPDQPAPECAE